LSFDMDRYGGPSGIVRKASHNIPTVAIYKEKIVLRQNCWTYMHCEGFSYVFSIIFLARLDLVTKQMEHVVLRR
jgi:hypothetical protein